MADLIGGVPDIPQVMIWLPVVVSDNHRVYGKKGRNTPSRARAREADQFTHILQAGSIPGMIGKREIAMKLLSALAVGLLLAGPLSAQTGNTRKLYTSMLLNYIDGDFKGFMQGNYLMSLMKDEITPELEGDLATLRGRVSEDSRGDTEPNYIYARRHYLEGANLGNGEAQYRLAKLLALGKGGPQDVVTAYMWSNISVLNETPWDEVISFRENLANIMTPRELLNAQRRARVCMASNYQDCG